MFQQPKFFFGKESGTRISPQHDLEIEVSKKTANKIYLVFQNNPFQLLKLEQELSEELLETVWQCWAGPGTKV